MSLLKPERYLQRVLWDQNYENSYLSPGLKTKEPDMLSQYSACRSLSKVEMDTVSWLLTVLCWPQFARYNAHIRVVLWEGTEELSFWKNNYFPLNLWVDASLWEEFTSKILRLLPSLFSLRMSCWPACFFILLLPCMVQNTIISVNLLTI